MPQFNDWCHSVDEPVREPLPPVMTGQTAQLPTGIQATAAIVPAHYASEEQVARALARLGKPAAAALIEGKLPTTKAIRSGDLGEIYATEWIDAHSGGYRAPIKRLRWKDHRNMAMRGDDVIAILQDAQTQRLHFLKRRRRARGAYRPGPHRSRAASTRTADVHPLTPCPSSRLVSSSWTTCRLPMRSTTRCSSTAFRSRTSGICSSPSPAMRPTLC